MKLKILFIIFVSSIISIISSTLLIYIFSAHEFFKNIFNLLILLDILSGFVFMLTLFFIISHLIKSISER